MPATAFLNDRKESVVQIRDSCEFNPSESGLDSGFVYDIRGYIVTNNLMVRGGGHVHISFLDGTIYAARLVGADPYADLVVLSRMYQKRSLFHCLLLILVRKSRRTGISNRQSIWPVRFYDLHE